MNIDFIKWMVGYADGFEWNNGLLGYYGARLGLDKYICSVDVDAVKDGLKEWVMWPHFLQRAIEGINRKSFKNNNLRNYFIIFQELHAIKVRVISGGMMMDHPFDFIEEIQIDQAKEAALKYIYEQEANDENKK